MGQRSARKTGQRCNLSREAVAPAFCDMKMCDAGQLPRLPLTNGHGLHIVHSTTWNCPFEMPHEEKHVGQSEDPDFLICIPLKGTVTLAQENRSCVLSGGDIGIMDLRLEYRLALSEETDALWVRIPRERLEGRLDRPERAVACRIDGSSGTGLIASHFILNCTAQVKGMKSARVNALSSIMVDLLCAAAIDGNETVTPRRKPSRALILERAKEFIERHLGDEDLSPSRVAAAVGISTRYLRELFAQERQSPMAWIADRRLRSCRTALETQSWTSGSITEIAFNYGFSNLSSFNRMFKSAFGRSPRSFMPR